MRTLFRSLTLLLSLLLAAPAGATMLDRIVAVAEEEIIMLSEVEEIAGPAIQRLKKQGAPYDPRVIMRQALDQLVLSALSRLEAKKRGLEVTDETVEKTLAKIAEKNGIPRDELPGQIRREGINFATYKESIRNDLTKQRLVSKVIRPQVAVSDEEIADLFQSLKGAKKSKEIHLGHIMLEIPPSATEAERSQTATTARELAQRLRDGASLASLAGQYSQDPSALNGGDMGWFKAGQLLPAMERALFPLDKGEVAEPLLSPQGLHIFQVLDVRHPPSSLLQPKSLRRARHILLKLDPDAGPDREEMVMERIHAIQQRLKAGEAFAELARLFSEGPSGPKGGDLGWFERGSMVKEFDKAVFALKVGEVSDPVRSPFGWHLIKLEGKRTSDPNSLEANRKVLSDRILETKVQARFKAWLRDLRLRSFVEYR